MRLRVVHAWYFRLKAPAPVSLAMNTTQHNLNEQYLLLRVLAGQPGRSRIGCFCLRKGTRVQSLAVLPVESGNDQLLHVHWQNSGRNNRKPQAEVQQCVCFLPKSFLPIFAVQSLFCVDSKHSGAAKLRWSKRFLAPTGTVALGVIRTAASAGNRTSR